MLRCVEVAMSCGLLWAFSVDFSCGFSFAKEKISTVGLILVEVLLSVFGASYVRNHT